MATSLCCGVGHDRNTRSISRKESHPVVCFIGRCCDLGRVGMPTTTRKPPTLLPPAPREYRRTAAYSGSQVGKA